ncbi:tetratricopeptide repeat protein, partial [Bacteroidota bacterium]
IIFSFLLVLSFLSTSTVLNGQETNKRDSIGENEIDNSYLFIDAKKELMLGNFNKAERLFKTCLHQDPTDDASMYELSGIYQQQNKTELAIQYAQQAVETDPANIWYLERLANIYKQSNQFKEASQVLGRIVELNPNNIEYLYELALTSLFSRDYKKAIECYNSIEEKIGISEDISIQKQKIYLLQNDTKSAIKEIEMLAESFPMESRYYSMLAELYLNSKNDKKALQAYNKVLEKNPEDPYVYISLSDYYRKNDDQKKAYSYLKKGFSNPQLDIETKINIILAYYTVEEIYDVKKDQAFELAEILVESHPEDHRAHAILADFLYQDKQYAKAKESLVKVLSIDSSRYAVWEQLLFVETELQDFKAIKSESKRAIDLFPNQPLPYLFSAIASFQDEMYAIALKNLERGVKFVIDNELLKAQFYSYIGDAQHGLENDEEAFKAYKKSLQINPDNSVVLNNYAYYLSLNNNMLEEARNMAKKAVELDPENGSNQDTYGWVLYKLGEYSEAKIWIKRAIDNHQEDNPVILEHYGDILYKLGDEKEALKYWKRAQKAGKASDLLDKKVKDEILYE